MKKAVIANTANETSRIEIMTAIDTMRNQSGYWVKGIACPEEPEIRCTKVTFSRPALICDM